uniref:Uncharacterized protein n=1 Tax=Panagrolaimus sp. ES5 TaxID=591445 RepID=A0AC34FSI2_9BILA
MLLLSAIQKLKIRNRVLKLADKESAVLQVIDAEGATKGLDEVASGLSKNVREYLTSQSATRKRRFQSADSMPARHGVG